MRFLASWAVYLVGCAVGGLMDRFDKGYPLYNRLMLLSDRIQRDGPGPWRAPDDEDEAMRDQW